MPRRATIDAVDERITGDEALQGGPVYLIQIFLPVSPAPRFARELRNLRKLLTDKFGGANAYTNAPVQGDWRDDGEASVVEDELIIVETMVPELDREFWDKHKARLESALNQDEILVRALPMEKL